jgi:hypothetical protein
MNINIAEILKPLDDDVSRYFRLLGYGVTWDFSRKHECKWYEVMDGERLVCQIDFGVPLADILEDLPLLAEGKPGTSKSDYSIRTENDEDFKLLGQRIRSSGTQVSADAPPAPCPECKRPLPVPFEDDYQHGEGCSIGVQEAERASMNCYVCGGPCDGPCEEGDEQFASTRSVSTG